MYDQNFRSQAVKEVKNGSSVSSVSRKFDIAMNTLTSWVSKYDEKMHGMAARVQPEKISNPVALGVKLRSISVTIDGVAITIKRDDALKILSIFNIFDKRVEGG